MFRHKQNYTFYSKGGGGGSDLILNRNGYTTGTHLELSSVRGDLFANTPGRVLHSLLLVKDLSTN